MGTLPWSSNAPEEAGAVAESFDMCAREGAGSYIVRVDFRKVIHQSNHSVVQFVTYSMSRGLLAGWQPFPDGAEIVKRTDPRSSRRADLQGRAYDYIGSLHARDEGTRLLAPFFSVSRLSDHQQMDFYPRLPATLVDANSGASEVVELGYDKSDVLSIVREFAGLARDVADFHERTGLVHRDIKPGNIGLNAREEFGWELILFDFDEVSEGVATPDDTQRDFTAAIDPGGVWTPPEIAFLDRGIEAKIPFQTDVWGLAAVLYWCVTQGAFPFGSRGDGGYLDRLSGAQAAPHPLLDTNLHSVLVRALGRDPWARPTTREFANFLEQWVALYLSDRQSEIVTRASRPPSSKDFAAIRSAWLRLIQDPPSALWHRSLDEWPHPEDFTQESVDRSTSTIFRMWEREEGAAVAIAHMAWRLGISFRDAVLAVEEPHDRWWLTPSSRLVPPLVRDVIPVLEAHLHVTVSPDGRVAYIPKRASPAPGRADDEPVTKRLPPDLIDTERLQ